VEQDKVVGERMIFMEDINRKVWGKKYIVECLKYTSLKTVCLNTVSSVISIRDSTQGPSYSAG
jgi:hypothetical protein